MRRRYHQSTVDVGLQLFSGIKRQIFARLQSCPEDYHYILPVGGFGELVFTLSQAHHLRAQGKVCMLLREDRAYLAQMWPQAADHFIFLSDAQFNVLKSLEDISFRSPGWLFICWADLFADGRFGIDLVLNNNRLTMKEMYAFALGVKLDVPVLPPVVGPLQLAAQPTGRRRVLLIQHAKTIARIPGEFWSALCAELLAAGYDVVVDVLDDKDLIAGATDGVTYYRTKVPELVALARSADLVIALRSGMADLMGSMIPGSALRMIVLYHVTRVFDGTPQAFHHTSGISGSGLNLARSFQTHGITDIEVCSDDRAALIGAEVAHVMAHVTRGAGATAPAQPMLASA